MPLAQIRFERTIELRGTAVRIHESAESFAAFDRPIGWTQHATLGPPFLERGVTQFRASATKSKVFESEFGTDAYLNAAAEFEWPLAPGKDGTLKDLRVMNSATVSSAYTAHLMDRSREHAFFTAWNPAKKISFGYIWKTNRFSLARHLGREPQPDRNPVERPDSHQRHGVGASPYPESRRESVDRGRPVR